MSDSDDSSGPWQQRRAKIAENPKNDMIYRIVIGVVGVVVLIIGIICIPFVGPGWLIVFAGLGILASEFEWAQRLLGWVKDRYDKTMEWYGRQSFIVKGVSALLTFAITIAALWLLNTFAMVGGWFGLDWPWLQSPLF
ncbi:TIGR02611 family protein [Antrihabitans stalactiti]|uniref:TIGR02611 family protein n=1 Tax=Antrihabitans stalactiti TaxID=2584121 RepID=A0A848KC25_9NOCA|nr:TIGR02611 family protein [Antrihabitans stalactiti]NMN93660.1 TIGR02611 family protein [Antrihabitans stalactiti]